MTPPRLSGTADDGTPVVSWDRFGTTHNGVGLATFAGPGGFTQQRMTRQAARGIADALGLRFEDEREASSR